MNFRSILLSWKLYMIFFSELFMLNILMTNLQVTILFIQG